MVDGGLDGDISVAGIPQVEGKTLGGEGTAPSRSAFAQRGQDVTSSSELEAIAAPSPPEPPAIRTERG